MLTCQTGVIPAPSIHDIEAQKNWEVRATEMGIQRYRAALRETVEKRDGTTIERAVELANTAPGLRIIHDMLGDPRTGKGVVFGMEELRQWCMERIASVRGAKPPYVWVIPQFSAETLAFITTRALCSLRVGGEGHQRASTVRSVAGNIGLALRDQCEFEDWKKQSAEDAKERDDHRDIAKALITRAKGRVTRSAFTSWRNRFMEYRTAEWSQDLRIVIGGALLHTAITHGGGWFQIVTVHEAGKTINRVALSPEAERAIFNMHQEMEIATPFLLPTICKPQEWRRESDADLQAHADA